MVSLNFCGPKCSHCCFVLSIWGILMLVVLGALFKTNSRALRSDSSDNTVEDMHNIGQNCFIAAGLYGATLLISFWQMRLSRKAAQQRAELRTENSYSSY
ncbi:hypothetical protein PTSG_04990 [Salpingoeca rosetta]|uniref:Uncharacterized protein n=1 Tax=Salpingoeca rosetta (strain ATCC 50818 / BSB-021) TaxID=946362 RepID=F2U973_SALR5|nr:uncharacterized protein PTSG_04990 [Salpingoeca rosetta]EGD73276.1 hypothetical protein PTSG_04990 [Salpingoeca rosetta]|eukprot:XP_004994307.1 hypothetical protein PTSG_04990 [Salpingoeca rosetta]